MVAIGFRFGMARDITPRTVLAGAMDGTRTVRGAKPLRYGATGLNDRSW